MFSQTRLAFDNAVLDEASGVEVRPHFFKRFVVNRGMKAPAPVVAGGASLEQLATGFGNASGLTTNEGQLFFTDAANHK